MFYQICLYLCLALEIPLIPLFLKHGWPEKTTQSLRLKMACSSLFVLAAVFAMLAAENYGPYSRYLLVGFAFCWLGDFLLHVKPLQILFALGALSFLIGHIFYLNGYARAIQALTPGLPFFALWEIILLLVFAGGILAAMLLKKMRPDAVMVVVPLYAGTLLFMVLKAWTLGLRMIQEEGAYFTAVLLGLGSLLFLISDGLLAVINVNKEKGTFALKAWNIVTYYSAQAMLAVSILFVVV